jgi:hypothetical protein
MDAVIDQLNQCITNLQHTQEILNSIPPAYYQLVGSLYHIGPKTQSIEMAVQEVIKQLKWHTEFYNKECK